MSISELNQQELRLLRNFVFARHGYSFNSDDLQEYFEKFEWYNAKNDNVNDQLNYADKRNIEIIREFESMDISQPPNISTKEMTGLWHASLITPSGMDLVFQFYGDGTYTYRYSEMRQLPMIDCFSGSYELEGNTIKLTINQTTIYEHSEDTNFSGAFGYQWNKSEKVTLETDYILRLPIGPIQSVQQVFSNEKRYPSEMADREVLTIGNVKFFKY